MSKSKSHEVNSDLQYKILRKIADRDSTTIDVHDMGLGHPHPVNQCARILELDGLIKFHTETKISSITPEGRALLDRLEHNRWQRRIKDWLIGFVAAVAAGLAIAGTSHLFGWKS